MRKQPVTLGLVILTGLNLVIWTALFLANWYIGQETKRLLILQGLIAAIWWISFAFRLAEYCRERRAVGHT